MQIPKSHFCSTIFLGAENSFTRVIEKRNRGGDGGRTPLQDATAVLRPVFSVLTWRGEQEEMAFMSIQTLSYHALETEEIQCQGYGHVCTAENGCVRVCVFVYICFVYPLTEAERKQNFMDPVT